MIMWQTTSHDPCSNLIVLVVGYKVKLKKK